MNDIKSLLKIYIENNLEENIPSDTRLFKKSRMRYVEHECSSLDISYSIDKCSNIEDYINQNDQYSDFQTLLFKLIDERNLKDSDVYNKVHIDRRLFSKIRIDKNYHPSKETIILLGIALELSENELDELLDSASYSFPKNNKYDLIIRFCFINKIFKLTDINDLLDDYGCKLFSY